MPQFTPWTVTDPTPNVLFNPIAAAQAAATTQSTLGDLAINQAKLGIEQQKLDATRAGNAALVGNGTMPGTTDATAGGGGTGGGGSFMDALAAIESGDKNIVSGVDPDNQGRTLAQGGNASEISQGNFQINTATWRDFAKQAGVDINQYPNAMSAPRAVQAQVASVIPFNRFGPRTQALMRTRFGPLDTSQTVGALAGTPALAFNPNTAGPRVGGTATTSVDPNDGSLPVPPIPPAAGDPNPANMAAVKQAASGLLAMPEADAATAYPGVVQELQSRGFAMNAPPTYPGHVALQALVNGGTAPVPVTPSPIAARTGGTDMAGPGAGPDTMPAVPSPNRMYETGLPGVQITAPGNPLAPPGTAQAPVTAPGAATRPPVPIPPPAPSRMIQTAPLIKGGPMDGLTANQAREAQAAGISGVPTAELAQRMEAWRQQNIANAQTAATANAAQQQADFARQQQYYENQVKAGWEDAGNGMIRNRYTGETKYAGPPSPRFGAANSRSGQRSARYSHGGRRRRPSTSPGSESTGRRRICEPKGRVSRGIAADNAGGRAGSERPHVADTLANHVGSRQSTENRRWRSDTGATRQPPGYSRASRRADAYRPYQRRRRGGGTGVHETGDAGGGRGRARRSWFARRPRRHQVVSVGEPKPGSTAGSK